MTQAAKPELEPLFCSEEIHQRVMHLATQISRDYTGKSLVLIGVLKGAWVFLADLVRELSIPVLCDFVKISSYGMGTESSGKVRLDLDVLSSVSEKHLLIVEDIIDTGISLTWLQNHLKEKKPKSIEICCLLDKPSRRTEPIQVKYKGFDIPDIFVVGYGIDWAEEYRNMPYIARINTDKDSHEDQP